MIARSKERMREELVQSVIVFSMSNFLPSSQISNIPWRRLGVKYTNNEAYFDLIEEIDAIIDRNGTTIMCEIQGYVSETKIRDVPFEMTTTTTIAFFLHQATE